MTTFVYFLYKQKSKRSIRVGSCPQTIHSNTIWVRFCEHAIRLIALFVLLYAIRYYRCYSHVLSTYFILLIWHKTKLNQRPSIPWCLEVTNLQPIWSNFVNSAMCVYSQNISKNVVNRRRTYFYYVDIS